MSTYTIKNGCGSTAIGNVTVTVNAPPPPQCLEDDDPRIVYDNGWHTIQDSNASAGHFHLNTGKDVQHALKFTFQLQSDMGTLQYFFAKSTKGGTAQVLIDGKAVTTNGTINYQASAGTACSGAAEANVNEPYTLVVIDPTGKVLGSVNSSSNGIASVSMPVSTSGLYVIQLVNVGLGPVNVWTAATPYVQW